MIVSNDIHTLTGAYVLDAVSDMEQRAFENHMADCPACTREVNEFRETTARLGHITATTAPSALWHNVRDAVVATRQLPPLPILTAAPPTRRRPRPARHWLIGGALFTAAASVVTAVVIGIGATNRETDLESQLAQSHSQIDKINAVLGAPDVHTARRSQPDGSTMTVVTSRQSNAMVLTVQGLPGLAPNQSFQAWAVTADGHKSPMGLFNDSHGTLLVNDLTTVQDASFLALTIEPRSGSPAPSGKVVITVAAQA
ncbi:hypothetical protein ALI144C_14055 [Actinosynnema sp. ALI-1.44]|uniref:anti-sigma factor n=1 Tax=Actinosynnema sp. ALI-1.44 TaxID=1933779 RepID=UPI00097C8941|nr:anti-sigma factor [Actinosynnema sp. ALI-1.44]ONI85393.1 hypothetical protein ALI144C_14055 [Actinosynnema sp. ALI-1.44]